MSPCGRSVMRRTVCFTLDSLYCCGTDDRLLSISCRLSSKELVPIITVEMGESNSLTLIFCLHSLLLWTVLCLFIAFHESDGKKLKYRDTYWDYQKSFDCFSVLCHITGACWIIDGQRQCDTWVRRSCIQEVGRNGDLVKFCTVIG